MLGDTPVAWHFQASEISTVFYGQTLTKNNCVCRMPGCFCLRRETKPTDKHWHHSRTLTSWWWTCHSAVQKIEKGNDLVPSIIFTFGLIIDANIGKFPWPTRVVLISLVPMCKTLIAKHLECWPKHKLNRKFQFALVWFNWTVISDLIKFFFIIKSIGGGS